VSKPKSHENGEAVVGEAGLRRAQVEAGDGSAEARQDAHANHALQGVDFRNQFWPGLPDGIFSNKKSCLVCNGRC
jgi:hypothetical protein